MKIDKNTLIVSFLIIFATIQFFLILRHKSPYLSDSYFYKHITLEIKGDSFEEAKAKVLEEVDLTDSDEITKNIFQDQNSYKNSYTFFTKRPFYPFVSSILSIFFSDYLAFLIPVFLSYLGFILLSHYIFMVKMSGFFPYTATALLISFYPFLDWSTYFLTDTISASFWMLVLVLGYRFLKGKKLFPIFLFIFALSLLVREQTILLVVTFALVYITSFLTKINKSKSLIIFLSIMLVSITYLLLSKIFDQRTVWDTIIYTENNYGLDRNTYNIGETLSYWSDAILRSHVFFASELVSHHWWFAFCLLALIGVIFNLKRFQLLDYLMLFSALASYTAIFLYPVLSYRYFFPVLTSIVYFCVSYIDYFFKKHDFNKKRSN